MIYNQFKKENIMPLPTIAQLNNVETDSRTIADVAVSYGNSTVNRAGKSITTLSGFMAMMNASLAALGYSPPVTYAAGLTMANNFQTVEYLGNVYAPVVSALPFTTSGTFETNKFKVVQGLLTSDLAVLGKMSLLMGKTSTHSIVVSGDSCLTNTSPVSGAGNDVVTQAMTTPQLSGKATVINTAQNGRGLAGLVSSYDGEILPNKPSGNIIMSQPIIGIGTNDFPYIGITNPYGVPLTVAEWLVTYDAYVARFLSDGFNPPILLTIPKKDNAVNQDAYRVAMNYGIFKIAVKYRCPVLDRDMLVPEPTDRTIFSDGTHPTAFGNKIQGLHLADILIGADDKLEVSGYAKARTVNETTALLATRNGYMSVAAGNGKAATLETTGANVGSGDFAAGMFIRLKDTQAAYSDIFGQITSGLRLMIDNHRPCIYDGSFQYSDSPALLIKTWYFIGWIRISGKIYMQVNDRFYGPIVNSSNWTGLKYLFADSASLLNQPSADIAAPVFISGSTSMSVMTDYFKSGGITIPTANLTLWSPYWQSGVSRQRCEAGILTFKERPVLVGVSDSNDTWQYVFDTAFVIEPRGKYILSNPSIITGTLSPNFKTGESFKILNRSLGAVFKVAQLAGQVIYYGTASTTAGVSGGIQSATASRTSIEVVCDTANMGFTVVNLTGGTLTLT